MWEKAIDQFQENIKDDGYSDDDKSLSEVSDDFKYGAIPKKGLASLKPQGLSKPKPKPLSPTESKSKTFDLSNQNKPSQLFGGNKTQGSVFGEKKEDGGSKQLFGGDKPAPEKAASKEAPKPSESSFP